MEAENQGLQNSLRCLQHPLSVIGIAALIFNDHFLKIVSPSWLTGKLSDFAGLFFFPFIVAASLSLLLQGLHFKTRAVGLISFEVTGVWFLLLKTCPPINFITTAIMSVLLGRQIQYRLDWTDTAALTMLWPAWVLWSHKIHANSSRVAYASLAIGTLACLATSPVAPPTIVTALVYKDGVIYAISSNWILKSQNDGLTWDFCYRDGCPNIFEPAPVRAMPIIVCDSEDQRTCYRITGRAEVEISNDSGNIWSIGWEVPPDRREFVKREGSIPTPKDMIIVSDGDRYLLVAMGNDGIIRRHLPTGEWERIAVYNAQPTPYAATNFGESLPIVWREIAMWMAIGAIALIMAGWLIWRCFPAKGIGALDFSDWALLTIVLVAVISIGLTVALFFIAEITAWVFRGLESPYLTIIAVYAFQFLFLRYRILKWLTKLLQVGRLRFKLATICLSIVVGVSIVGILSWPLWALGIISRYQTAQIIATVISVGVISAGYLLIYKTKSLASKDNTNLPAID